VFSRGRPGARAVRPHLRPRRQATLAILVGVIAWCVVIVSFPSQSLTVHEQLPNLVRTLSSGLCLMAGVLHIARWGLTSDSRAAQFAAALFATGALLPVAVLIGPLLNEPFDLGQTPSSTRALLLIPVFALLMRATTAANRGTLSPRFIAAVGAVSVTAAAVTFLARQSLCEDDQRPLWLVIAVVVAAAWLVVARRVYRPGFGTDRDGLAASGFTLLALAEVVREWCAAGAAEAVGIAPGVELAAVILLVCSAAQSLRQVHRADASHTADLARAVVHLKRHLDAVEAAQRERIHDARTVVTGVLGASELLNAGIVTVEPERLRCAMTAELERLQTVLDARASEPISEFDLADVLQPVILVHQLSGCAVHADLAALRVAGRPRATATVLDNLLQNVRMHAPGAQVWIRAARRGLGVRIVVEDDGPGIPADERGAVLRRGVRGRRVTSPGDGLGLYTASAAMRAQHGSLELGSRPGGGTQVLLTLPSAVPAALETVAS
jgi:signal transduction histidine kinase